MKTAYLGELMKRGWALLGAVLAIAIAWTVSTAMAAPATPESSAEHLVSVYDRGEEHAVLTRGATVADALKDADIDVDPADIVEPALTEKLIAKTYHVNVYRARPVVVEDGNTRIRVMTAEQSPRQIAAAAKVTLYDEDITKVQRVDDVINDGGAGLKLKIDRATPFSFVLYGKKLDAHTQAKTVGEMLAEKKVKLAAQDGSNLPMSTPIVAGMSVEVWRNGVQTITQEEEVTMPIRQVKSADQPVGFKQVQTPGKPGKKQVSYELNLQNGKEISRKEIQTVVTLQPIEQVEIVGTKSVLPVGSHEDWMAAAGIAPGDWGYVNYIVMREGGWEPCKVQGGAIDCSYSGSMGYGIVQATPGGKMVSAGADWRTNPITQLKWANGYAVGRYGSWAGAYNHWLSSHNW